MAPVTRLQRKKALSAITVLAPQNQNHRISRSTPERSPRSRVSIPVVHEGQAHDREEAIIDAYLEKRFQHVLRMVKRHSNITRGIDKELLSRQIEGVLETTNYGRLNFERHCPRISELLNDDRENQETPPRIVTEAAVKARMKTIIWEDLIPTHALAIVDDSSTSDSDSSDPSFIPSVESHSTAASNITASDRTQRNRAIVTDKSIRSSLQTAPTLATDEKHGVADMAFTPKSGKDIGIEFALLELLSTLGRDSLEDINYEDFVRAVQIIKYENLSRIELKIHWDTSVDTQEIGQTAARKG